MGRPVPAPPLRFEGEIGVAWVAYGEGSLISHPRAPHAPKGAGDLLAALFTAGLVQGRDPVAAAACAVSAVAEAVASAGEPAEFPVAAFPERLGSPRNVRIGPLPLSAVHGVCPPKFDAVRVAFAGNFAEGLELGARFAVAIEGEVVIDLMAGWADRHETTPFGPETLTPVFSTTKAMRRA